jgi:hypothetical protein
VSSSQFILENGGCSLLTMIERLLFEPTSLLLPTFRHVEYSFYTAWLGEFSEDWFLSVDS